jgi:hypothetical protein
VSAAGLFASVISPRPRRQRSLELNEHCVRVRVCLGVYAITPSAVWPLLLEARGTSEAMGDLGWNGGVGDVCAGLESLRTSLAFW